MPLSGDTRRTGFPNRPGQINPPRGNEILDVDQIRLGQAARLGRGRENRQFDRIKELLGLFGGPGQRGSSPYLDQLGEHRLSPELLQSQATNSLRAREAETNRQISQQLAQARLNPAAAAKLTRRNSLDFGQAVSGAQTDALTRATEFNAGITGQQLAGDISLQNLGQNQLSIIAQLLGTL